jgi:TetR/AcrR family transcriptional regulator, cholesterol catabolism regulator
MLIRLELKTMAAQPNPKPQVGPEAIREARVQWRRSQIIEAATELMEERGFHEMSVNALAKAAGLSVGTIYQYVEDKTDILLMVIVDILEAYRNDVPPAMEERDDPLERLAAAFDAYCRVVDSRRYATVLAYRESKTLPAEGRKRIMALEVETTGLLRGCLDDAVATGVVGPCDTGLVAHNLTMLAHAWALKHWHLKDEIDIDTYIARQLALTIKAIVDPAHTERYSNLVDAATPRS